MDLYSDQEGLRLKIFSKGDNSYSNWYNLPSIIHEGQSIIHVLSSGIRAWAAIVKRVRCLHPERYCDFWEVKKNFLQQDIVCCARVLKYKAEAPWKFCEIRDI